MTMFMRLLADIIRRTKMRKIFILIVSVLGFLPIQAQETHYYRFNKFGVEKVEKEVEDEITFGDYHFKCYDYDKVKGGGKYYFDYNNEMDFEELRLIYDYFETNLNYIERKYNVLIILPDKAEYLIHKYFKIHHKDKYEDYVRVTKVQEKKKRDEVLGKLENI